MYGIPYHSLQYTGNCNNLTTLCNNHGHALFSAMDPNVEQYYVVKYNVQWNCVHGHFFNTINTINNSIAY